MLFKSKIAPENGQDSHQKIEESIASKPEGTEVPGRTGEGLSPEELAKVQSLRSKMVSASFGEMVTLLMKSPHYRHYNLADLEWLLIPPLMTNQFLVVEAQLKTPATKEGEQKPASEEGAAETNTVTTDEEPQTGQLSGVRIPVGMALWAKVSPEVDTKLSENIDSPIKLRPDEWRSGEINWLIEIIGDQKIMAGLYEKLKKDVFKGQTFKVRAQNDKRERFVKEVSN